jgi:hypothetical protein
MKKHHKYVFWHEKLFEKHPQPHCQISLIVSWTCKFAFGTLFTGER